jgi:predicted secreted hydrolase
MRSRRRQLLKVLALRLSAPGLSGPAIPGSMRVCSAMAAAGPFAATATTAANAATPALASGDPAAALPSSASPAWNIVRSGTVLRFPQDHGAHPGFRTEWWYVTGWLQRDGAADAGFQITFFRSRTAHPDANPSRFAPTQLVLAHAALALPENGRLLHAQRAARAGFGLATTATGDTRAIIGSGPEAWSLTRDPATDRYRAHASGSDFAFTLELAPDAPPLLQGQSGYSRKGPSPSQASHYYSRPQMAVTGSIRTRRSTSGNAPGTAVRGRAWFDHEWSSDYLGSQSSGWDWIGINLDDGGALMAFQIRSTDGKPTWRDATLRRGANGPVRTGLSPVFETLRSWRSVRSGAQWPVSQRVRIDDLVIELEPLFDDQELDARGSTGITYWEGAVTASVSGRRIGRGYLELTGYAGALRF